MKKIYIIILSIIIFTNNFLYANKKNIDDLIKNYNQVPIEEKIAQMLIVGFSGGEINDEVKTYIKKYKIGGVILFNKATNSERKPNIENFKQVRKLNKDLQDLSEVKLFIATDQEGGKITRLNPSNEFAETLSHQELGKIDNLNTTYDESFKIARMLQRSGFNYNFAPSVDLNINPNNPIIGKLERSFGKDPIKVFRHANAYIKAHHQAKIITSLKHYPGHGSSLEDSHKDFVDITNQYQEEELQPYIQALKNNYKGTVMIGHLINKKIDSKYPASLSVKHINGILRNKLGFQGVIITDDLKMRAIEDYWDLEEMLLLAINAGNDILIYSNNLGVYNHNFVEDAINIIKKNIYQGKISRKRIDQSYLRIMNLKKEFLY